MPRARPALALALAGIIFLLTALALPFVAAEKFGQGNEGRMLSGALSLFGQGQWLLAGLVGFCGFVAPLLLLGAVALAAGTTESNAWRRRALHWVEALEPWAMPDVRMLAIIVAFVKLSALVRAIPAAGLWCYGAAAFCTVAAVRTLGARPQEERAVRRSVGLAAACGVGAMSLLVPAYLLPVMSFERVGDAHADTILTSVLKLWQGHMWGLASIVFIASVLVPLLKLLGLGVLIAGARRPGLVPRPVLARLHAVVHGVGRWSMLDVFLVAFLCGLVQFGELAKIEARPGVVAFAGAVVLTMWATASIDGRLFTERAADDSLSHEQS